MSKEPTFPSLGSLALLKNDGKPSAALSDLMTSFVSMCEFIHKRGASRETTMSVYDALCETARAALLDIIELDEKAKSDAS